MDAEVTAISIVDVGSVAYSSQVPGMTDVYSYLEEAADAAVDQVRQEGENIGVVVKTVVKDGVPAHEIIEASKGYDLIVMGTLGRTGLSHLLIGSVAEKVVRFANCAVLVIRAPKDQ
jgi:nucleotide-binding universal stress UspA family protein